MKNGTTGPVGDSSYMHDKGIPSGENAKLNQMPPGENIAAQKNADIRDQPMRTYSGGTSYPTDGG